jgi:hypothetical protein
MMPRSPNYRFERSERAKTKALKKAEKLQAKVDKSDARKSDTDESSASQDRSGDSDGQ